jgi:hypothetical protein
MSFSCLSQKRRIISMTLKLSTLVAIITLSVFPVRADPDPDCHNATVSGERIKEQTFPLQTKAFGKVTFAPFISEMKVSFYLLRGDSAVYAFPGFYGNIWIVSSINAVAFVDVNGDGLKDVLIIGSSMTGAGPTAAQEWSVVDVYFQTAAGFANCKEVTEELNKHGENLTTIATLSKYLKKKYFGKPLGKLRTCEDSF